MILNFAIWLVSLTAQVEIIYRVIYESKLRCNMSVFINKVISLFCSVDHYYLLKLKIKKFIFSVFYMYTELS